MYKITNIATGKSWDADLHEASMYSKTKGYSIRDENGVELSRT